MKKYNDKIKLKIAEGTTASYHANKIGIFESEFNKILQNGATIKQIEKYKLYKYIDKNNQSKTILRILRQIKMD